jgi:hypothetical protein
MIWRLADRSGVPAGNGRSSEDDVGGRLGRVGGAPDGWAGWRSREREDSAGAGADPAGAGADPGGKGEGSGPVDEPGSPRGAGAARFWLRRWGRWRGSPPRTADSRSSLKVFESSRTPRADDGHRRS